ncbi:pilus assembly protein PilM [Anaerocolumna sedimenticola]|uniref:Pilus assembly protein PilM n=1 Tax=Anaerocolumna sedimenticola TaxID=2696063 RepID=A0A6P1TQ99_9FIRM|nr:pilus assembly protein PilM [Anaerocolumna sedimenticola]QHQ61956.1 pilus assembly protein PilM [Anaerocolumna sedimenticola]
MAKVLSIEIGLNTTRLCLIETGKKNTRIYHACVFDTPEDSFEDGYIKNAAALADIIKNKLSETKIRTRNVIFTISSSKIAHREVIIPLVKESKIPVIITAGIEDYFPIDISEYNVTYTILEKVKLEKEKHYRLLVLAVQNNLILSYYELAKLLNLKIKALDYSGNSIFQMVRKQVNSGINMFIQINKQDTLINILRDDILVLQRTVSYGYEAVLDAITENTLFEAETEAQAVTMLTMKDILYTRFGNQMDEIVSTTAASEEYVNRYELISAREDVTDTLHYLINNILRVMDYFTSKNQGERIQSIYITGSGAGFLGIDQLFTNELGYLTSKLTNLTGIQFKPDILPEGFKQSDFIACIGAVLNPVNIKPGHLLDKAAKRNSTLVFAVVCTLAVVISSMAAVGSDIVLKSVKDKYNRITSQIEEAKDIEEIYTENKNIQYAWITMESIEEYSYSNNENLGKLLLELQQKLPDKVIVRSFRATNLDILMDLTVDSKETAAMTLSQLKKVSLLANVKTDAVSEQMDEYGITEVNFSITANYVPISKEE